MKNESKQSDKMEVLKLFKIEDDNLEEEELLKRAKQISLQDQEGLKDAFQDQKFVDELLGQIPGVDQNSEEVKKAIEDLKKKKEEEERKPPK